MKKYYLVIPFLLFAGYMQCEIIDPDDITQTSRKVTICGCHRSVLLPEVPLFICDAVKEFSSKYANYNILSELSDASIYYKGGNEAYYYTHKIPTVVYLLYFNNGPFFVIEANSRTVLEFYTPKSMRTYIDVEIQPYSDTDLFSKATMLLKQYELPTNISDYIITQVYTDRNGVRHDENSIGSNWIETEISYPQRQHDSSMTCDYIQIFINRYTGALTGLTYFPSSEKIQEWCNLMESKQQEAAENAGK